MGRKRVRYLMRGVRGLEPLGIGGLCALRIQYLTYRVSVRVQYLYKYICTVHVHTHEMYVIIYFFITEYRPSSGQLGSLPFPLSYTVQSTNTYIADS